MDYMKLRPKQFRAEICRAPVAYLPLGTLEWHGEHLPLGSDALQAHSFFLKAAAELGGIVLPPLFVGPDRRDQDTDLIGMDSCPLDPGAYPPQKLAGSAYWIDDSTFAQILSGILRQVARAGFKAVVAHGHGPSTSLLNRFSQKWQDDFGLAIISLWNELGNQGLGFMVDHAAANETSLMMALHPELVDLAEVGGQSPLVGIAGLDPRIHASADLGSRIIEAQISWLKAKLTPWISPSA